MLDDTQKQQFAKSILTRPDSTGYHGKYPLWQTGGL